MPSSCVAYGCSNRSSSRDSLTRKVSFHNFPIGNPPLLNQWLVKIRRQDFTPTSSSRICSDHFEEKYFTYQNFTNKRFLRKDAIPTIFVFNKKLKLTEYYFGGDPDPVDRLSTDSLESTATSLKTVDKEVQTNLSFEGFIDENNSLRRELKMMKDKLDKCDLLKMLLVCKK